MIAPWPGYIAAPAAEQSGFLSKNNDLANWLWCDNSAYTSSNKPHPFIINIRILSCFLKYCIISDVGPHYSTEVWCCWHSAACYDCMNKYYAAAWPYVTCPPGSRVSNLLHQTFNICWPHPPHFPWLVTPSPKPGPMFPPELTTNMMLFIRKSWSFYKPFKGILSNCKHYNIFEF